MTEDLVETTELTASEKRHLKWQSSLEQFARARDWVSEHLDDFSDTPAIVMYPERHVSISLGHLSFDDKVLATISKLLAGKLATKRNAGSTYDFEVVDKEAGLIFRWYVWKDTAFQVNTTEVVL